MIRSLRKRSLRLPVIVFAILASLYGLYDRYVGGNAAAQGDSPARLIEVHDGDTVSVMIGGKIERVRLVGIDAPELAQRPWGPRAKTHLRGLLSGEASVTTDVEPRDKYGRLLAYIWTSDGKLVNLEMVRDGYAVLYTIAPNVRYADQLKAAQREAREKKKGLWEKGGLKKLPREYRKEHPRR